MTVKLNTENRLVEFAYIVQDVEKSIDGFLKQGIGPWFYLPPFISPFARLRGVESPCSFSVGMCFNNDTLIELMQTHNDAPSIFDEMPGASKYGFHHWARMTADYEAMCDDFRKRGYECVYTDQMGDARLSFFDTRSEMPGMMEVIEVAPIMRSIVESIHAAAQNWDGSDPIRPFAPPK